MAISQASHSEQRGRRRRLINGYGGRMSASMTPEEFFACQELQTDRYELVDGRPLQTD
jgi:hypothetical protein